MHLIKTSNDSDSYILKITDELDEIDIENFNKLKSDSKGIIFLTTKNYRYSLLFQEQYDEAIKLVDLEHIKFMVKTEEELDMSTIKHKHVIINTDVSILKSRGQSYTINSSLNFSKLDKVSISTLIINILFITRIISFS